jgi:hypothetical protein
LGGGSWGWGKGKQNSHYAIDVRTAWAQEHFPEHCRIRNYQEPDALQDWMESKFDSSALDLGAMYFTHGIDLKEIYELGQANPTK